jgi:hypothetical protein
VEGFGLDSSGLVISFLAAVGLDDVFLFLFGCLFSFSCIYTDIASRYSGVVISRPLAFGFFILVGSAP